MRRRLPLVLPTLALVVAVLGTTPLGSAAGRAVAGVVPYARKAGFAQRAAVAENAKAVGGTRRLSSRRRARSP